MSTGNQNITSIEGMKGPTMDAAAFLGILVMPHVFSGKNRISSQIVEPPAEPEQTIPRLSES